MSKFVPLTILYAYCTEWFRERISGLDETELHARLEHVKADRNKP
jgi:hypothetical protein